MKEAKAQDEKLTFQFKATQGYGMNAVSHQLGPENSSWTLSC
jgi:hypothetical protein